MSSGLTINDDPERTEADQRQIQALIDVGLLDATDIRPRKRKTAADTSTSSHNARPTLQRQNTSRSRDTGLPGLLRGPSSYTAGQSEALQASQRDREPVSSVTRLKEHRNSAMAAKSRDSSRRERTFVGSSCAACEEPLEHMLQGERVLQLSCGHISHEACFYEYIKDFGEQSCPTCQAPLGVDPSRGGGIDFEKLNRLVRSAQKPVDPRDRFRDTQATPTPSSWDHDHMSQPSRDTAPRQRQTQRNTRDHLLPNQVRRSEQQYEQYQAAHGRNTSGDTGAVSAGDYSDAHGANGRRHDYDVQSMETSLSAPRVSARNPIPSPTVTIRSEFPTLSKSRQQQSLTCLVTIEVPDHNWQANPEDLRGPPSQTHQENEPVEQPKQARAKEQHRPVDSVHDLTESREALESAKDDLIARVDNWHGLDYTRFGRLIIYGTMRVGKDRQSWQELECYLFTEMLICVKEKKPAQGDRHSDGKSRGKCTLKGSILIKRHLKQVQYVQGKC